jgi:hypothetical protein
MKKISNETEFKAALKALTPMQQRQVGTQFVENVLSLATNTKLTKLLLLAQKEDIEPDELAQAYQDANYLAVKTYTVCGADGDWMNQAKHFVAAACAACLKPETSAWTVAMNCRLARVCDGIAQLKDLGEQEIIAEYQILQNFLNNL